MCMRAIMMYFSEFVMIRIAVLYDGGHIDRCGKTTYMPGSTDKLIVFYPSKNGGSYVNQLERRSVAT